MQSSKDRLSPENAILFVARDLSYIGGTELFMVQFLLHLAQQKKIAVSLYETDGHAQFENTGIYDQLESQGVQILKASSPRNAFWNPENAVQLSKIAEDLQPTIVHSFLFNADFAVLTAKLGVALTQELLSKTKGYEQCMRIMGDFQLGRKKRDDSRPYGIGNASWHSTKFASFSVALEEDTPEWHVRKNFIDNDLEPIVSRYADAVHVVASEAVEKWAKWNSNISVAPCSSVGLSELSQIDALDSMVQHEREWSDRKGRKFVVISRLVPGKGLELLIDAFLEHILSYPEDTLIIGGDGELRHSLQRRALSSANIFFLGQLSRTEVFQTYLHGDVAVLLSESEGLPLVIQEGMACKKPVLATQVGGLVDLVKEGKNGLLIPPKDLTTTCLALATFSSFTDEKLSLMGMFSRQIIEKNFLREKVFDQIMNSYQLK